MDLSVFTTFLAVVHHRTFVAAGNSLGLSKSAVSQQIKGLEEEFGIQFFDRTERPPKLTAEGEEFCECARRMIQLVSEMKRIGGIAQTSGVLTIGGAHTLASGILAVALKQLRVRHPDLEIRVITGLAVELEMALRRGNIDAAVLAQPDPLPTGLVWQSCCTEPLVVVAADDVDGVTDAEILENNPFIRFKRVGWGIARMADTEFSRRGIQVRTRMEVDTLEAILSLVQHGLGVSVVPLRHLTPALPVGVRHVPFGAPPLHRTIGVLHQRQAPRLEFVQWLIEELVAAAAFQVAATE